MKFLNHNLFTGDITVNGTTTLSTATGVTRSTGDNTTHLATTAFVKAQDYATNTALGNYVPLSRTLTINNVTYDLSADRSWTIGTSDYTSVVKHVVKAGVAITKGQAIYVTSANGTNIIVGLASNATEATSSKTMGLAETTVAINGFTNVVTEGLLAGLNTVGANAGDPVWLGTGGNLIYGLANKPYAPAHLVFIGIVTRAHANQGEIFVKVQNGFELKEIHDVDLITVVPVNGEILGFNGTLWVNKTIAGWLGYTPANASGTTNYVSKFTGTTTLGNSQIFDNGTNVGIGTTSSVTNSLLSVAGGINTTTGVIGYNTADFFTFNGKVQPHYGFNLDPTGSSPIGISGYFGIALATNGAERFRILNNGNVGIGTTSPGNKLDVIGNILVQGTQGFNAAGETASLYIGDTASEIRAVYDGGLDFFQNGVHRVRIESGTGNFGIGTSDPNYKLHVVGNAYINETLFVNQQTTIEDNLLVTQGIGQNNLIGRPAVMWSASGTSTGAVMIKFPGTTGNYGMVHAVVDIYEYNGNTVSTIIIGGHNWNGAWYAYGANLIGQTDKQVRLAAVDGAYAIVIGDNSSSWSYGQVVLRKIQNGGYYQNVMNVYDGYIASQTTSLSASWISGDLRRLVVSGVITANGGNSGEWNTAYSWGNHASAGYAAASSLANYLPLAGGTMSGTLTFAQPVGLSFANGQYIKDNNSGGLIINSGAAVNITGTSIAVTGAATFSTGAEAVITWARTSSKNWALASDSAGAYFKNTTDSVIPIYMTNAGNVGIGTTDPTSQMSGTFGIGIYNASYPAVGFKNSTTAWLWYGQGSTFKMWNVTAGDILTANTSGNVGIGTTSPTNKLQVANGDMSITSGYSFILADTDTNWRLGRNIISPVESVYLNSSTFEFVAANASDQGWQFINDDGYPVLEIGAATGSRNVWVNAGNLLVPTGNVGIGTASPVSGQGTPLTLASSTGYVGLTLSGSGAYAHTWQLYASGDGGSNKFFGIYDGTNAAYRLVATSGGNVGIGTTSPGTKLDVNGVITATGGNSTLWNTAYGWGNHASAGYLTSYTETDTLATVTARGSSTNGSIFINGVFTGGLGAVTTSGTLDWNDVSNARAGQGYTLLLGTATNGMGGGQYYHPVSFEYSSKNGSGNMTQLAIPYTGNGIWYRNRYVGSWSSWARVWDDSSFTSTNISNWNTAYGWGNHASQGYATQTYVNTAIANLVDSAPATLDTLNELAAALGDDPNFATTVTNSIAAKLPLAGGTMSGTISFINDIGTALQGTVGINDYWRIYANSTTTNAGYLEIATSDDGTEPIYVRQYTGVFSSLTRTATLLDGSGNTSLPGSLTVGGTITENSSIRYKENVVDLESATEKVEQLRAVRYNKIGHEIEEIGLIAEEVAEVYPEVVNYNEEGQPDGVNYTRLSVILLKALQEQNAVIASLSERINKLESK